ncbi:hypothetical protein BHE74_00057801 [Ensete ventricosum]|nr:hypothetical protein BHE74_00057801 [Ensete ventricosum]RZS27929.1 hypothetical protein BHM03_00061468 [Ensete ventricosum]
MDRTLVDMERSCAHHSSSYTGYNSYAHFYPFLTVRAIKHSQSCTEPSKERLSILQNIQAFSQSISNSKFDVPL